MQAVTEITQKKPLIIIIVGLIKSKKSTLARFISRELSWPIHEMSDVVRAQFKGQYTINDIISRIDSMRQLHGPSVLAEHVAKKIKGNSIVCGVRSMADYEYLTQCFPTYTIFVYSTEKTRFARLDADPTSVAKTHEEYAKTDRQAEMEGLYSIARSADITLNNELDYPATLYEQANHVCNILQTNYNNLDGITKRRQAMENSGYEVKNLPIYSSGKEAEHDVVSRVIKSKGELATISVEPSSFIAYVDFPCDGEPRANHFHEEKIEHLYLVKGKVKLFIRKAGDQSGRITEVTLNAGDLVTVFPGYAHAYVTEEEGFAIEFSPTSYEVIARDKVRDFVVPK